MQRLTAHRARCVRIGCRLLAGPWRQGEWQRGATVGRHTPSTVHRAAQRITSREQRGGPMKSPESFRVRVSDRIGRYVDVPVSGHAVQVMAWGTPGLTPTGAIPDTLKTQARQAWLNVQKILAAAGPCWDDIVSVRSWPTNPADILTYSVVCSQLLHHEPVFALRVVQQLMSPGDPRRDPGHRGRARRCGRCATPAAPPGQPRRAVRASSLPSGTTGCIPHPGGRAGMALPNGRPVHDCGDFGGADD